MIASPPTARSCISPPPLWRFMVAFVVTLCVVACINGRIWNDPHLEQLLYADSQSPMVTAEKSFRYLGLAQNAILGVPLHESLPPPAQVLVWLHKATTFSLTALAFWLPMGLGAGLFLVYGAWACLLRLSLPATAALALTASLLPAWVERSHMGCYDTDVLTALLLHLCLVLTASMGLPRAPFRGKSLLALCLCGLLLAWWQPPGALALPGCLLLWGVSFFWAPTRVQAGLRLGTALLLLGCGLCFLLLPADALPPQLLAARVSLTDQGPQLLGLKARIFHTPIFPAFDYLPGGMDAAKALRALGGGLPGALLAFLALCLFIVQRPAPALFLLPALIMLFAGFAGQGHLYLAALPLALAVTTLPHNLADLLRPGPFPDPRTARNPRDVQNLQSLRNLQNLPALQSPRNPQPSQAAGGAEETGGTGRLRKALWLVGWLCSLTFVGQVILWQARWIPDSPFKSAHDAVAVNLRRASPPQSPVWNWRDDGYFLQARTSLRAFFDGGSQDSHLAWLVAHPLASADPVLARRWIRFFALRGQDALQAFVQLWGEEAAWQNLEALFRAPDPLALVAQWPSLPADSTPAQVVAWFFPPGRVFLYLPQRFLPWAHWWIPAGTSRQPKNLPEALHIEAYPRQGYSYTPGEGSLILPPAAERRGYTKIGAIFDTGLAPLTPPWGGPHEPPYLVTSPLSPWLYIVDKAALQSLAFRLLAPGAPQIEGFRMIAVNFAVAGAWEVLPDQKLYTP